MSVGRIIGGLAASMAVVGCAAVAIGMSRSDDATADGDPSAAFSLPASHSLRATFAPLPTPAAVASLSAAPRPTPTSAVPSTRRPAPTSPPATTGAPRATAAPRPVTSASTPRPTRTSTPSPAPNPVVQQRGSALPLRYSTGTATRVITVTAHSRGSTVATLQAWSKAAGGGWRKYGVSVTAHIGSQGMSAQPSESKSATPIGSFTLTQAFGHDSDPGTTLPYFKTGPADWWISQAGSLYNTHQRCSTNCPFTRGSPNEHLYYETPYYNYAVVIDYNTRNAPGGVRQGAGSAFFLHVTDGGPTAGCVAISQSKLVSLMRWLTPSAHPRILIGVV